MTNGPTLTNHDLMDEPNHAPNNTGVKKAFTLWLGGFYNATLSEDEVREFFGAKLSKNVLLLPPRLIKS